MPAENPLHLSRADYADATIRGQLAGLAEFFLPGDAQINNDVPSIHTDDHQLRVRTRIIGMQQRDRDRFEVDFVKAPQDAPVVHATTHLLPKFRLPQWITRRHDMHRVTFEINEHKLQEDPEKGLATINSEVDRRIKLAGHNMVHTHPVRNILGLEALFGVGTAVSHLYKISPLQVPNITLFDWQLPFEVHLPFSIPFDLIPQSFTDIRLTTAFLAGTAAGFAANRLVHKIGNIVHEWRTDRRFAYYDRVASVRRPVVSLVSAEQAAK